MRRALTLAFALVMIAGVATAADAPGPYKLDAKGGCHAANGSYAKKTYCATATPAPSKVCGKSHIAANKTCHK